MALARRVELFVHVVWSTSRRRPWIRADIEGELHNVIGAKCVEHGCIPRAIGGMADHLHLLVLLDPGMPLTKLVAEVKGSSSHAMTHRLAPGTEFQWQRGYAAFSISPDDVAAVERYVLDQKRHHGARATDATFEPSEDT
ncbi:MAG: IS200/IS605 family transposase [Myxococcales bacterium]|nr:IS200/IS605 family transposase [Myxococcales bacterium]